MAMIRTKFTNEQVKGATAGTVLASDESGNAVWGSLPTRVTREVPTGDIDGANKDFVLSSIPQSGTEEVYLNGILQNATSNDYSISGATITFVDAPLATYVLLVSYNTSNFTYPGPILDGGVI